MTENSTRLSAIKRVDAGKPWGQKVGYSRAVRVANQVFVCGTVAADEQGKGVGPGDAYEQARFALIRIGKALGELGARYSDVVRTRIFVTDIGPDFLVEIEADALIVD